MTAEADYSAADAEDAVRRAAAALEAAGGFVAPTTGALGVEVAALAYAQQAQVSATLAVAHELAAILEHLAALVTAYTEARS